MNRKTYLYSLLCFLLIVPGLAAQEMTYEDQLQLIAPTVTGETGLFETINGETLRQGTWSFSIYFDSKDWVHAPLPEALRIPSARSFREMDTDENRLSVSLGYGLTDRWEITAQLPYVMIDQNAGDLTGFVHGRAVRGEYDESGLGDLHLATKFNFLDPAGTSDFALSLFADVPTGDEDVTSGSAAYGAGLHWNSGIWNAEARYNIMGERDAEDQPAFYPFDFELPDEVHVNVGVDIPITWWDTTNWISEVNTVFFQGGDAQPDDQVFLMTGLRHWFGMSGWGLSAAVRANVTQWTGDSDACPFGGLFGLHYAPFQIAAIAPPPPAPVPVPPPPPPAPEPVTPPPPPVAPPPAPVEIRVDEIHFEPGSARLTNIAKAILDDVALRMRQEAGSEAIVTGYVDAREAEGPNANLDRLRAEAVRDYLVSRHNIDPTRIRVEAGGVSTVGDNATAEGRLRNRRVVIRLINP